MTGRNLVHGIARFFNGILIVFTLGFGVAMGTILVRYFIKKKLFNKISTPAGILGQRKHRSNMRGSS